MQEESKSPEPKKMRVGSCRVNRVFRTRCPHRHAYHPEPLRRWRIPHPRCTSRNL